jgi:opacity protein-like surface antigen
MAMKKLAIMLVAFAVVVGGVATPALAGPYFSVNAGAVWVEDSDLPANEFINELSYKTGYGITAALGNAYDSGFRAEVEVAYRINSLDEEAFVVEVPSIGDELFEIDGDISSWGVMANGYYDFANSTAFKPFIGAGVGYVNVRLEDDGREDDSVFAYQLMAGCGYAMSNSVTFDLQYRYFATDDPDFDGLELDYRTHNLLAGLRFDF